MQIGSRFVLFAASASFLGLAVRPAAAQGAAWTLTLDAPDQTVPAGAGVTVVYTGTITNTDPGATLNVSGDSFSVGNFDSSLTLSEDAAFTAFLNNTGSLTPGQTYSGPLFDLADTAQTPAASVLPYGGTFEVTTDGTPNNLSAPFTLTVASAPEPPTFAGLVLGVLGLGGRALRARRRPVA